MSFKVHGNLMVFITEIYEGQTGLYLRLVPYEENTVRAVNCSTNSCLYVFKGSTDSILFTMQLCPHE